MASVNRDGATGSLRSSMACLVCRKRKIKCGRELPRCSFCDLSCQDCSYPQRSRKPGPKIGSSQAVPRKRAHASISSLLQGRPERNSSQRPGELGGANFRSASSDADLESNALNDSNEAIQSLSFIIHPSHESCSPEQRPRDAPAGVTTAGREATLLGVCLQSLGITYDHLDRIIDLYFETFTSFQLFREVDFREKVRRMTTLKQVTALVSVIAAFAFRSSSAGYEPVSGQRASTAKEVMPASYFADLAMKYVIEAVDECEDEPVPLSVLQTLILATHWLLIQGVRGRAWRFLGLSVRTAYEQNLHLIDAGKTPGVETNVARWIQDEERRRAWWAIWEMEVFATFIRRCPTAIDWSQNETFLPAEDENWFQGRPEASCFLDSSVNRWKPLEEIGNQSPKAWFIVVKSFMKDAQTISSPNGIDKTVAVSPDLLSQDGEGPSDSQRRPETLHDEDALNRLSAVHNSLRCYIMTLPSKLRYHHQYLSFGAKEVSRESRCRLRLLHSSIYSIHLMTQLTKLMIYKYYIFRTGKRWSYLPLEAAVMNGQDDHGSTWSPRKFGGARLLGPEKDDLEHYFDVADEIMALVSSSSNAHYRYVNPFLANTIWLAAAVQLVRRELSPPGWAKELIGSRFELLCLTYNQFVKYWDMSATLTKNFDIIKEHAGNLRRSQLAIGSSESFQDGPANPTAREAAVSRQGDGRPDLGRLYSPKASRSQREASSRPVPAGARGPALAIFQEGDTDDEETTTAATTTTITRNSGFRVSRDPETVASTGGRHFSDDHPRHQERQPQPQQAGASEGGQMDVSMVTIDTPDAGTADTVSSDIQIFQPNSMSYHAAAAGASDEFVSDFLDQFSFPRDLDTRGSPAFLNCLDAMLRST